MHGSMGCRALVVLLWRTWRLSRTIEGLSDLIMTIHIFGWLGLDLINC
jgi:hypothetical protein